MQIKTPSLEFSPRAYLYTGLLASLIVGIAEYLLHYTDMGPSGEIDMLLHVPLDRARIGHYLAITGLPLYFAGYYGLYKIFRTSNQYYAKLLFITGTLSFTVGGIWLSSRYFAAVVFQKSVNSIDYLYYLSQYEQNYQVLVWALRLLILLVSLFFILAIKTNKIGLSKWLILANPLFILGLVFSSLIWFKPLGNQIAPIAMNVTHFIFFSLLTSGFKKR